MANLWGRVQESNLKKSRPSKQQELMDKSVADLHEATKELRTVATQLDKTIEVLKSKVDAIQAPSRLPWPFSLFR
ncbi:hypothetical protein Pyn_18531 [Prunus yedoensis var. nudiflora]|uniref:Uncharacterized protein n=1 Tax=Prunus yedoensis var. nudiflora TaxID=2094558 RepID=A0A314U8D5_PRUYE|nr:hypothetical protein Pyn_18531 [Prunus yedoensis var. nudiflora]